MAFSRTPRTVRPKDPRDVASPHPLSDAALGSSLLLDVLVGARRAVARSTRHDVRALFPVRYRGGAKLAALRAPHTRAEGRHRHIVRPTIDVDLGVVPAGAAGDVEPAHAVPAHVAERHRLDRLVIPALLPG